MLVNFLCPPGGFSFKTAFDEDYARFSPGVLLQQANLDLLEDPKIAWVDSCAAPGHPMIDSVWRERRSLVWMNVPLSSPANRLRFAVLGRSEPLCRRCKGAAAPASEVGSPTCARTARPTAPNFPPK